MTARTLPFLLVLAACGTEDNSENVTYEELGTFTSDADGVVNVPWKAPEGVVSNEVLCGPYGYDTFATADAVLNPAGETVYDDDTPFDGGLRVGVQDDLLPVLIPVSPTLEASAGDWALQMFVQADELPTTVSCGVVARVGDVAAQNSVDIAIVFVGVDGLSESLNATSADGDAGLQAALSALGDLWSDLGLSVGNIRYTDFDGAVETYTTVEGYEEFGELLRSTPDGSELTFYLVQDIDLGDGASILGLSGGPPGAASQGATSKSGVVINVANLTADPDQVGLIMAHEGGHFLGLFHPTENDSSGVDPLEDTPECTNDADSDGTLTSAECEGSGAENVMWPTAQVGTATAFSSDQGWVVARNPIVNPG